MAMPSPPFVKIGVRFLLAVSVMAFATRSAQAQLARAEAPKTGAPKAIAPPLAPSRAAKPQYRPLAPGVMKTIEPQRQRAEEFSRHDVIEILAADPNYAERDWSQGKSPARDTVFRRNVWALDFAFKPIRFVHVDVPGPDGRMQRKLVWYLVYSVKNPGDKAVAFVPQIVLATKDSKKVYPDRLIPLALPLIRKREDPNRRLLNTSEITGWVPPSAKGDEPNIWGVATWEDIDPTTDYFAIYVQGLTNAYLWEDPKGAYKKGQPPGTGREFFAKTLILNFWRPSDKEEEHEEEIRFETYEWEYGQLTGNGFVAKKPDSAKPVARVQVGQEP